MQSVYETQLTFIIWMPKRGKKREEKVEKQRNSIIMKSETQSNHIHNFINHLWVEWKFSEWTGKTKILIQETLFKPCKETDCQRKSICTIKQKQNGKAEFWLRSAFPCQHVYYCLIVQGLLGSLTAAIPRVQLLRHFYKTHSRNPKTTEREE